VLPYYLSNCCDGSSEDMQKVAMLQSSGLWIREAGSICVCRRSCRVGKSLRLTLSF
jgi:hypothetical protein